MFLVKSSSLKHYFGWKPSSPGFAKLIGQYHQCWQNEIEKKKANKLISDYLLIYLYITNNRSLICSAILHNPMAGSFKTAQDFFHEAVVLFPATLLTWHFCLTLTKLRANLQFTTANIKFQLNWIIYRSYFIDVMVEWLVLFLGYRWSHFIIKFFIKSIILFLLQQQQKTTVVVVCFW